MYRRRTTKNINNNNNKKPIKAEEKTQSEAKNKKYLSTKNIYYGITTAHKINTLMCTTGKAREEDRAESWVQNTTKKNTNIWNVPQILNNKRELLLLLYFLIIFFCCSSLPLLCFV